MRKIEVINQITKQTGKDIEDVKTVVEAFFKVIKNKMSEGENIYIRGFGSFINKKRASRKARNISEKKTILIDSHYIPTFKPSKAFVERIRNNEKVKIINEKIK